MTKQGRKLQKYDVFIERFALFSVLHEGDKSERQKKCLCRGHQLKDCKGQRNCSNCGGRHHQSICLGVFRESQPTDSKIKNEEATSWGSATTIATTSTKKAKGSILLQTAAAIATNESPFPYEFCSTMAVNAHT